MVMNEGSHNSACDSCTTVMSMVDISVFACGMALPKGYVIMRISAWIWNAKQAYKIYNYIYLIILYLQAFCWWLDVACSSDFFPVLVLVPFLWWICACKSQRTIKTAAFEEFPDCSHTHSLSIYIPESEESSLPLGICGSVNAWHVLWVQANIMHITLSTKTKIMQFPYSNDMQRGSAGNAPHAIKQRPA